MLKFNHKQYFSNFRLICIFFFVLIIFSHFGNAEEIQKKLPVEVNEGKNISQSVKPSPVNGEDCTIGTGNKSGTSPSSKTNTTPEKIDSHKGTDAVTGKKPDKELKAKLLKAMKDKNFKLVWLIMKHNPELANSTDENNIPFLKHAVDSRLIGVIRGFLDDGADPDVRIENNMTLLIRECKDSNDAAIARFLIEHGGASVNVEDDYGMTPLGYAVKRRKFSLVKFLVSKWANVNCKGESGYPILLTASCLDDSKLALYLIEHGARVDFVTKEGYTPMHGVKNEEVARFLLVMGLNPNARDIDGNTPLHWLATLYNPETDSARTETAKILISGGAKVNEKNNEGKTPLHNAVNSGFIHLTKYLVLKGAKVDARDNSGKTPMDNAIEHRNFFQFLILFSGYLKQYPIIKVVFLILVVFGLYRLYRLFRSYFPGKSERKPGEASDENLGNPEKEG